MGGLWGGDWGRDGRGPMTGAEMGQGRRKKERLAR